MKIETIEPTAKHFSVKVTEGKHSFTYYVESTGKGKTWFVTRITPLVQSRDFKPDEFNSHHKKITEKIKEDLLKESK